MAPNWWQLQSMSWYFEYSTYFFLPPPPLFTPSLPYRSYTERFWAGEREREREREKRTYLVNPQKLTSHTLCHHAHIPPPTHTPMPIMCVCVWEGLNFVVPRWIHVLSTNKMQESMNYSCFNTAITRWPVDNITSIQSPTLYQTLLFLYYI